MKIPTIMLAVIAAATAASQAQSDLQITEVMYTGLYGEFTEVFNVGTSAANLNNYVFNDNAGDHTNGVSLADSAPGADNTLEVGEALIITEADPTIFRRAWYVLPGKTEPTGLRIVGNVTENLGRSDASKIFNGSTVEDVLTWNDAAGLGPRSEDVSIIQNTVAPVFPATTPHVYVAANDDAIAWVISTIGTGVTWKSGAPSATGTVGSPGYNVKK